MNKYFVGIFLVCIHSVYGCVEFINDTRLPLLVAFDTTLDMWYDGKNLGKRFFAEELILPKDFVVAEAHSFAAWNPLEKKIVSFDGVGTTIFTPEYYQERIQNNMHIFDLAVLQKYVRGALEPLVHPETKNTIKVVVGSLKHCIDGWAEKLGYTIWYPDVNKDWSLKYPLQWKSVYFATREGGNRRVTVKIILNSEGKPEFSIDTALTL